VQIDIQTRGFALTKSLAAYVKKRLRSAIGARDQRIMRLQVRLADINGPRGGVDKCCQFHVALAGGPDVIVRDTSADMYSAIDNAAARASRSLGRKLSRLRPSRKAHQQYKKMLTDHYSLNA